MQEFTLLAVKAPPSPTSPSVEYKPDSDKIELSFMVPFEDGGKPIT
jgi:hypothetical protein